jgi:PAS domain S-box-containing protein
MRTKDRRSYRKQAVKSASHIPLKDASKLSIEFLSGVMEHIPYPVFIKDRKHRWVALNRAFTELLGYPRQKMLGKSDYAFFPRKQADFFWGKDNEMYRTGRMIDIPEEPITNKKGKLHWIHTRKAPLADSSGRVTHLLGIIEDITQRKLAE